MAQIFPKWTNRVPLYAALAGPIVGALVLGGVWYFFSPEYTDVGYMPVQPVPYSHKLHVGELGLDCLYCHVSVERSAVSNVPSTKTCMNCHTAILNKSELLEPIRASWQKKQPMRWVRVHDLGDYAYFNHAIHVNAGVGCQSCHGNIADMEEVYQTEPLSMRWCLDCHRQPELHLRPLDEVTSMDWTPPRDQEEIGARLVAERGLEPPEDCSACHR